MAKAKEDQATIVKKVKNGALFSDGSIRISNVRFSYPNVVEPFVNENDDGKKTKRFKIVGMIPKTKDYDEVLEMIRDRIAELLKENKVKALPADKKFLSDGDESGKDESEGFWLVSASEKTRPTLRHWHEGKSQVLDEEDEDAPDPESLFYGGAWGSLWINPWFQNHAKYGKRVNSNLRAVMFKKHDEPFGKGKISDEEVDEAFDEDDDDDNEAPRRSSSSSKSKRYEDEDPDDI
jgi:hypothetical protein